MRPRTVRFTPSERVIVPAPRVYVPSLIAKDGRLYGVPRLDERIAEIAEHMQVAPFLDRPTGKLSAGQIGRAHV